MKKILIAEDEKPLANALQLKLTNEGFNAVTVSDGQEALDKIAKEQFDLILLDLMMPKVDGFGVLEALKKNKNTTPVIVTTNLSQPEDFNRVKALGAREYIVKSNTSLLNIITRIKQIVTNAQ